MRRLIGWCILPAVTLLAAGCSMTQTAEERTYTFRSVAERDARALVDDLELLTQTERPSRLTRWQER